jgi:uncharacterized membrane protein
LPLLSDAVFAIAVTSLIIEITGPHIERMTISDAVFNSLLFLSSKSIAQQKTEIA